MHTVDAAEQTPEGRITEMVVIYGGLPGEPQRATVGAATLVRAADETLEAFQRRAFLMAEETGQPFAFVGGLPGPDEVEIRVKHMGER